MKRINKLPRPPLKRLPRRIGVSCKVLLKLLYFRPAYLCLALVASFLFYEVVFWFLNAGLLHFLLTTEFLSLSDKVAIVASSYTGIFSLPLAPVTFTLFIVSLLQGVAVAALAYAIRHERGAQKGLAGQFGGTGVAGALSVLGLGCIPCGTSLITPIITFFFATSSAAVADKIGFYAAIAALIISVVTVYLAGIKLAPRLRV